MKKISKVLSVLLALLMMLSIIPITASAADTYTVKYNPNGGSGTMTNTTFNVDEAKELRANSFTRSGHTFIGWSTDRLSTTVEYTDKQSVTNLGAAGETVTLYAIWRTNTYIVEFNPNGGEGEMPNQVHTYGTSLALSANTFTREGYTFLGWAKTKNASSVLYTDQKEVKNLSPYDGATVVLYALWKKNPVTVESIFVETEPTKTEYYVGDTLNTTGLIIGANLSDNTVRKVMTGFTVSTPDMSTTGEKTVTVTYEGFTTTFTINVAEKPVYNYTFSIVPPAKTEIAHGESVVVSAKLEGTYPEGMYVKCTANNTNFIPTLNEDGSYTLTADGVGATVFTATLYTADNQVAAEDTIELVALAEVVEEPSEPEEPSGGIDIMAILLMIVDVVMKLLQPVIDFVKGLVAG